jgi:MoaA/NifB/PqqE/SkfB family radical SAM enzyme
MNTLVTAGRKVRSLRAFVRGLAHTAHPLLVQIIPIRRCNIDCGYCNEYDKISAPVPADVLRRRIDKLAELGTSVVAFSGGEPMLHPELDGLIRHIRRRRMLAGLITNGYFLVPKRIQDLNRAGLDFLQISIDNVEPDEISKKSLRLLDRKLEHLREHAAFDVNINSVLGGGIKNPEDARVINQRARELGFSTSIGIIHDGVGRLKPLGPVERRVYDEVSAAIRGRWQVFKNLYSGITGFQDNLADGRPNDWRCRAGARYLYVCEDGLVH